MLLFLNVNWQANQVNACMEKYRYSCIDKNYLCYFKSNHDISLRNVKRANAVHPKFHETTTLLHLQVFLCLSFILRRKRSLKNSTCFMRTNKTKAQKERKSRGEDAEDRVKLVESRKSLIRSTYLMIEINE